MTAGELAEALLYYSNVHVVIDYSGLHELVRQIGMPTLLTVLNRKGISAVYCEDALATHNETKNGRTMHSFITYRFSGSKETGILKKRRQILEYVLESRGYSKKQARQFVDRFRRIVPIRGLGSDYYIKGGVPEAAKQDLLDDTYVEYAARLAALSSGLKKLPAGFYFRTFEEETGIVVETNLDFGQINAVRRLNGDEGDWSTGHILESILSARGDTTLASHYGGEFYTSELTSSIIRLKYHEILRKIELDQQERSEFEDIVIENAPSLQHVINSGQKTFGEFLLLSLPAMEVRSTRRVVPGRRRRGRMAGVA